jgi:uncharacterized protein (TIGR03435 family)
MRASAVVLLAALAGVAAAQQRGDVPPLLVWNSLKSNCPASLDWINLRGKVVVIHFGDDTPDSEDVAEWNEVAQQFRDEPVLFLRIESGPAFFLDQALRTAPYLGCILMDREGVNVEQFKLAYLGRPLVVDQLGVIAGYARHEIEAADIRALLKHETAPGLSEVPAPAGPDHRLDGVFDSQPSYAVQIAPSNKRELLFGYYFEDRYVAKGVPLKRIVSEVWETPEARISFPPALDEAEYSVVAHIPADDRNALLQTVRSAIEKHFGLSVHREIRTEKVYLLKASQTPSSQIQPYQNGDLQSTGGGPHSIGGSGETMRDIACQFECCLDAPVIDETGISGKFTYTASSNLAGTDAAFDMAHQLGLELIPAERPIEILVVRTDR